MSALVLRQCRRVYVVAFFACLGNVSPALGLVAAGGSPDVIHAILPGDADCDGAVNANDAEALAYGIIDPAKYAAICQGCPRFLACDVNEDGDVNNADIDAFALLLGDEGNNTELEIGTVPELTAGWNRSPVLTAVPLGHEVEMRGMVALAACVQSDDQNPMADLTETDRGRIMDVSWEGAQGSPHDTIGGVRFDRLGVHTVTATAIRCDGEEIPLGKSVFVVTDATPQDVQFAFTDILYRTFDLSDNDTNQDVMDALLSESIADVRMITARHYLTSIKRRLGLQVTSTPAGFTPLAQLYLDAVPINRSGLGPAARAIPLNRGQHTLESGRPSQRALVRVQTYEAVVNLEPPHEYPIPEGEPVRFTVKTFPPGHEAEVRWLAGTNYGASQPANGRGPTFTCQFDDAWGYRDALHPVVQALGVRADNGLFYQGQETGACCFEDGTCALLTQADCDQLGGNFLGTCTVCDPNPCNPDVSQLVEFAAALDQEFAALIESMTLLRFLPIGQSAEDAADEFIQESMSIRELIDDLIRIFRKLNDKLRRDAENGFQNFLPILNRHLDRARSWHDRLDDAIGNEDVERIGDLLESLADEVDAMGRSLIDAGQAIQQVPGLEKFSAGMQALGTFIRLAATLLDGIASLLPFAAS